MISDDHIVNLTGIWCFPAISDYILQNPFELHFMRDNFVRNFQVGPGSSNLKYCNLCRFSSGCIKKAALALVV